MKNQENTDNFNSNHESQKRKWSYNESNSYINYTTDKPIMAKKCITSFDYENYQPNQQFQAISNGQDQQQINVINESQPLNCNQHHQSPQQMLNTMEINENIEYVNILYDDDLLTSIQAPVATETNYINFEPNWSNADILDLDQRNYYYGSNNDTTNSVNLTDLNGQLSQQNQQDVSIHSQQLQIHQHDVHHNLQQSTNNQIHVSEYEVLQHVYVGNENGRDENAASNSSE